MQAVIVSLGDFLDDDVGDGTGVASFVIVVAAAVAVAAAVVGLHRRKCREARLRVSLASLRTRG